MRLLGKEKRSHTGFTLIEIIITLVVGAVVGVVFLSFMGTSLTGSGDPVNIARDEALAQLCMELIISDYVREMNSSTNFTNALALINNRDYTAAPYHIPASVALTRTYITYDASGNEVTGGSVSTNLKVTIKTAGNPISVILTAQRASNGDPVVFY
jgi:prepilin-type N-terminal cleavage/methylation domain-containing protein